WSSFGSPLGVQADPPARDDIDARADRVGFGEGGDGFLVGGAHQGAGALRGERADDDGLGLVGALGGGALVVGHGERFHGRRAGVAGGGRAGGVGGGHLDGAEELGGRVRGVHADAVFGDVPAQRGGQPVGAGVGAEL